MPLWYRTCINLHTRLGLGIIKVISEDVVRYVRYLGYEGYETAENK